MAKRVAKIGIFVALAMVFSYIEVLIPFNFGIPGVKLGVANVVIVSGIYLMDVKEVFFISVIRILLMGMLFGNGVSLLYSLAGGVLSLVIMLIFKKINVFSITGVSIAGGVFHNVGQLLTATMVIQNEKILYYFPILLVAGVITGMLIGIVSVKIVRAIKTIECRSN